MREPQNRTKTCEKDECNNREIHEKHCPCAFTGQKLILLIFLNDQQNFTLLYNAFCLYIVNTDSIDGDMMVSFFSLLKGQQKLQQWVKN
jgi:hypothetical protein